jgi:hypothetical protein
LEVDAVSAAQPKKKKKKDLNMWIHEDADNIVDFTDRTAARKITGMYTELMYSHASVSTDSLFVVSVIRGLLHPEKNIGKLKK